MWDDDILGLWKDLLLEDDIWGAVGCHPKSSTDYNYTVANNMKQMLMHPKMIAVGEIGLDYSGT